MSKRVYIKVVNFMSKPYGLCDRMWLIDNIPVVKHNISSTTGNERLYLFSLGQLITYPDQKFIASCMKCRVNYTTQEPQCQYEFCNDNSISEVYCSKVNSNLLFLIWKKSKSFNLIRLKIIYI